MPDDSTQTPNQALLTDNPELMNFALMDRANASVPNPPPPTTPPPVGPAPDLGTGTPPPNQLDLNQFAGPSQQPQQPAVPKQSNVPALYGFMKQMFGGQDQRGYQNAPPGQPGRPNSRLDAFENFLGNFLNSFSSGMSNAGQGPAANARGFGAAVQAPYQRQVQQYQMGQQAQVQQAQIQQAQAEAQLKTAESQMVTVKGPDGTERTMPASLAKGIIQADVTGQWKVKTAETAGELRVKAAGTQKPYMSTPFGVLDTRTGKYLDAKGGGLDITTEMAQQLGLPPQAVGQKLAMGQFAALEKAKAATQTVAQGAAGPSLVDKLNGRTTPLNLGSPQANSMAQARQDLAERKYTQYNQALGPAAQKTLMETVPVHSQIQGLMSQFESMKDDNTSGKFAEERLLYAIGQQSPIGDMAGKTNDTIANLELNRVVGAARVLKGGSRSIEALNMAMKHLPNVWVDSPKLIYSKLSNLNDALQQIEDDAYTYGKKSGVVPPQNATPPAPAAGGGPGAAKGKIHFTPHERQ
jgi:hypothetical protein